MYNTLTFMHFRNLFNHGTISPLGGCTLALGIGDSTVEVGVAICNDETNFNKKIGRDIASGRLKAGKARFVIPITPEMNIGDIKSMVSRQPELLEL